MRQTLTVLVSLSLYSPASLLAYNDLSSYNRPSEAYSFTPSQNNWQRNFNARENFNSNSVMYRPPIQFPKINIDFTFQNTFKSFSNFNSNTFTTKLDLNYNNSFASNSFKPNPVVQNYNFRAPTNYGSNINQESFSFQSTSRNINQGSSFQQTRQNSSDATKSLQSSFQSSADFGRLPSGNMNQRSLMLVQPSPATNLFKSILASPTNLVAMGQPASNFVQQSFNKFIALPGYNNSPTRTPVTTKVDPAAGAQSRPPTGFFDGVARVVKAVPSFFASIGNKIKEAVSSVWNRVVLGHRTENTATLPDGSRLQGQITINRKDKILSVAPGTVRTVGEIKTLDSGQMALIPGKEPIQINGEDYLSGNFTYDGENYLLDGPGVKLTNQAGPTIETDSPFKEYVNGDGKGNVTTLGFGALARNDTFRETSTGLAFRNTNGVWSFDPNQSAKLKLDGKTLPVTIDEQGRFKEAVKTTHADNKAPLTFITNVLPNPATSGYEVGKVTSLTGEETLRTEIPGTKPSLFATDETNDWRHKTGVILRTKELSSDTNTNAKIHQEGDHYVFTSGHVASVSVTEPGENGQKTLYTEAMFGTASRLTVTGPTEFPNYGTTVIVGKVAIGGSGKMDMGKGTIFAVQGQGLRLTIGMNGKETTLPVKSVDMKAGTFVATIPNITGETPSEHIATNGQAVKGRIDFDNGQAVIVNTAFSAPLQEARQILGVNAPDAIVGTGRVFVKDNVVMAQIDRSHVNLDKWQNPDARSIMAIPFLRDTLGVSSAIMAPVLLVKESADFMMITFLERGGADAARKMVSFVSDTINAGWEMTTDRARQIAAPIAKNMDASLKEISQADPVTANKLAIGIVASILSGDIGDKPLSFSFEENGPAVVTINGVLNNIDDASSLNGAVNRMFGIKYSAMVLNRSHSMGLQDVLQVTFHEYLGSIDAPAIQAAIAIRQGIKEKGEVYVVAHSQGTAIFSAALHLLTGEEKSKVHYLGLGAEKYISAKAEGLADAKNVRNARDLVPLLGNTLRVSNWLVPTEWQRKRFTEWVNIDRPVPGNRHSFEQFYKQEVKVWVNERRGYR